MKKSFYVIAAILICLAACQSADDKSAEAITGIYIQHIDGEFAKGTDSLIVQVLDKEAGTYSIDNNYGFVKYHEGKEIGPGYTTKKYTGVYDKEHKRLLDNFKGMTFTFVPEKNILLMGSAEYRKVK